ncbi:secreted acid phosphatase, partial [mine drainage metagenome]
MRRPAETIPSVPRAVLFFSCLSLLGLLLGGGREALANPLPPADHAIVIVMENKSYREIAGNPDLPSFNGFTGERFTNYWSVAHPSLPNYIALLGAHPSPSRFRRLPG